MGISTSRLCDRRAYRGRIDGEYRMRAPSLASRSRTRGWRTATGPMPVMISRSGRWPWRTTRCWPVSVLRSVCFARNSATSASTAWVSNARAPLRRISVRESVKAPGWASLITLLSDTAYHSFIGEVEALNTTTIRRLTRSRRHQLLAIARRRQAGAMAEISYRRHRFPPVIIQHAVWLYLRFTLSYRDVEELLAHRGLDVSYETVRSWVLKFEPIIARRLRCGRPQPSNRWHLDEIVVLCLPIMPSERSAGGDRRAK